MPFYNPVPLSGVTALYAGDVGVAFNAEQPVAGQASQQFAIGKVQENAPRGITVELSFAGAPNPGWEFDVQEADTDAAIDYFTAPGGVINGVNANNVMRAEIQPLLGKFVRILCKTPGGVAVTAKISG